MHGGLLVLALAEIQVATRTAETVSYSCRAVPFGLNPRCYTNGMQEFEFDDILEKNAWQEYYGGTISAGSQCFRCGHFQVAKNQPTRAVHANCRSEAFGTMFTPQLAVY
jgi:hypothetical protein